MFINERLAKKFCSAFDLNLISLTSDRSFLMTLPLFLSFPSSLFSAEFFGTRHFVTFMLFLGMANAYVMRTNMSVAIVAMVNHTYNAIGAEEVVDDECPDYNSSTAVSWFRLVPRFWVYKGAVLGLQPAHVGNWVVWEDPKPEQFEHHLMAAHGAAPL